MLRRFLPIAALALCLAAPTLKAQEVLRVGVCNPAKVFELMDERNNIQEKMKNARARLQAEAEQKKKALEDMKKEREALKPGTGVYEQKNQEMMQAAVNFEVWARLAEAEMARQEKDQIRAMYDKIKDGTKEVALDKKLDLVIAEHSPQLPANLEQLTPDQVRQLIGANDVLFMNEKADITQAVVAAVNKKYAAGAATPPKDNK